MKRFSLLLILLISIPVITFSQIREKQIAADAITKGNYAKALKYADKAIKLDKLDAVATMYKSQAYFYLFMSPDTKNKYPKGFKDALKFAERALDIDNNDYVSKRFKDYISELSEENNKVGITYYMQEKYSRAEQHFELGIKFNPIDTASLFHLGACYYEQNKKESAAEYLRKVAEYNFNAYGAGVSKETYSFKTFRYLAEYYMEKESWDTAGKYISMGVEIFPDDRILQGRRYGLIRVNLENTPPSEDYLYQVRNALTFYPYDSVLLTKENSIYMLVFKQMLRTGNTKTADSLLGFFVSDRIERSKREDVDNISRFDIFIAEKPVDIFRKLLDYSVDYYHKEIFAWLSQKWVSEVKKKDFVSSKEYLEMAQDEFGKGNTAFASLMLLSEYKRESREGENEDLIIKYLQDWSGSSTELKGLDYQNEALGSINKTKNGKKIKPNYRIVMYKFIDSLAANNYLFRAYDILDSALKYFPEDSKYINENIKHKLALTDFHLNYYGTRMSRFGQVPQNGELAFETDMYYSNCEPGTLSDEILENILDRINYFRRASGIRKQVYFVTDYNLKCQYAAVAFEANKNLTHNPVEGLRCYTQAGKEGSENSLLVKESNPAIAITAIMGDKSKSQGNRRWMTNPLTVNMGFGAGPTTQVLWVMDQSNLRDTGFYRNNFVAYPRDFTPKMLNFSKWTFSIFDNLEDATIIVKDKSGKALPVKVETLEYGYGMPTLVFQPEFKLRNEEVETFEVNIKLKNGKKFNYNVNFFDVVME